MAVAVNSPAGNLRVAMVTARALPFMGGIETHVHEVSKRLAASGVQVTVLTTDTTGAAVTALTRRAAVSPGHTRAADTTGTAVADRDGITAHTTGTTVTATGATSATGTACTTVAGENSTGTTGSTGACRRRRGSRGGPGTG